MPDIDVFLNGLSNTNTVNGYVTNLYVGLNSVVNANTVSNVNITIGILLNSSSNTSSISGFRVPAPPIYIAPTTILNNNTVSTIIGVFFPNVSSITIPNTNTVQGFGSVSFAKTLSLDSFANKSVTSNVKTTLTEVISLLGTPSKISNVRHKQKINFNFSDITLDFINHPLTGDLGLVYDNDSIKQSIGIILNTNKFERPFNDYDVASQIRSFLFDMADGFASIEIPNAIMEALMNHEPRIIVDDIKVKIDAPNYSVSVSILYRIKKTNIVEEFKTLLKRT